MINKYNQAYFLNKFCKLFIPLFIAILLGLLPFTVVYAEELSIQSLEFASLSGDKVQLQLGMNGNAVSPRVFQTDNPARIALDFEGVSSGLSSKSFAVNKGAATNVYVISVSGRTRVIINLSQPVSYTTQIQGQQVLVSLSGSNVPLEAKANVPPPKSEEVAPPEVNMKKQSVVARLLPKQFIRDIDFRRGEQGNGLLMVALANPNTVVDVKEKGGKVVLKFLNTKLPPQLHKLFDVSDFATPVQKVEALSSGTDTLMTVSTVDGNYEYSSFQTNGVLTVDFKPVTPEEKEAAAKAKFPFTGDKLSLNFQDIPIRDVLQILADFTDFNMIATDTVGGNVTLRLNDVPWDQALDLILKSKGLGQRKEGNIVWIAPSKDIGDLAKVELESQKAVAELEPLRTEYIQVNYAKADTIKTLLVGTGGACGASDQKNAPTTRLLSCYGSASVDVRTNTLIIKDSVKYLDEIRSLVKLLDIPVRQVMIEARIVSANKDFAKTLGAKFGVQQAFRNLGSGKQAAYGVAPTVSGVYSGTPTVDATTGQTTYASGGTFVPEISGAGSTTGAYLFDLGAAAAGGTSPAALAMTLARAADYVLNLELSAMQNENKGEILANPRVMTSDRMPATITSGDKISITTPGTLGSPATQTLVDANLKLTVTPQITPNGSIIMELSISNDTPSGSGINIKNVTTTVQINDGETVVLGGVYNTVDTQVNNKVPFFGDLPGVGFLFRNSNDIAKSNELLFFVTPKIVKDSLSTR
ncbi:MAG: hypothetical protein RL637_1196 [Pseudomonadota bacterium]|jgi:type IV pilus assembly protein PilQ